MRPLIAALPAGARAALPAAAAAPPPGCPQWGRP
jgi:hypothetical protein